MALFGFLKNIFGKDKSEKAEGLPEREPAAAQEEAKLPVEAAEPEPIAVPEAEPAVPEAEPAVPDAVEPAAAEAAAEIPEAPAEAEAVPEASVAEEAEPVVQAVAAEPEEAVILPFAEEPEYGSVDIDGPLAEGDFPVELLDDALIPPEAYDYDDDAAEELPVPEATPEVPAAVDAFPEAVPQIFLNPYKKISEIIGLLRRYAGQTQVLFCRDAAAAEELRLALEERGFRSVLCTSGVPADAEIIRKAAAEPTTLLVDDVAGLAPIEAAACAVFCEMPVSLADFQAKAAWAGCEAVYVLYQAADFVAAMQRMVAANASRGEIAQLNRIRAWLAANGSDARELSRKIAAETPVAQSAGSCAAMVFVVTGKVNRFPSRTALKNYITEHGGILGNAVNKDTNYLITNDTESGSVKNRKAAELGTRVISEDEFIDLFCGGVVPGSKQK